MSGRKERQVVVYAAAGANLVIAVAKFFAAAATGSAAMFAEGIHSTVDTGNEMLLLLGLKRSKRPPDDGHPFGYGKELYFWSLIVALVILGIGGGLSIFEGIDRLVHRKPLQGVLWSFVVLGVAALFEGSSWLVAHRTLRRRRPNGSLWSAIHASKDPSVFSPLVEDSAALIGIVIAFVGLLLASLLHAPALDAVASIAIGLLLATMATVLAHESRLLLVGESVDSAQLEAVREIITSDPDVQEVVRMLTMQLGPDDVLLNVDLRFREHLPPGGIAAAIDRLEQRIRERCETIHHMFVEAEGVKKAG